ncbi:hypothetical protein [Nonomuraea jabiensis]|uniref:hypothetical protein n=1 Tax=Nonomuraea jabiensis TaxID=882448 RepID=UPI003D75A447
MGPFSVVRWVRAASFAASCAGLATLGHLAGGGHFDGAAALIGFALLLPPALALTGRERSLSHILPATALSQIILHILLSQSTGVQHAMGLHDLAETMEHHASGPSSMGMLPMHGLGVLLTAAWLRWVEAGLCALGRQLADWVLRPLLVLLLLVGGWSSRRPPAVAPRGEDGTGRFRLFLRYALVRRGPPRGQAGPAVIV